MDFGNYGNFDDFINDLLGRFGGPSGGAGFPGGGFPGGGFPGGGATVNLDAEANLKVSFAEAFHGCERSLQVNQERVQVRIPAGVRSGSRLRLKGKGNLQPSSGRRGDLYLNISLDSHPVWSLDGDSPKQKIAENVGILKSVLELGDIQAWFLSQAAKKAYEDKGIEQKKPETWGNPVPSMRQVIRQANNAIYASKYKDKSFCFRSLAPTQTRAFLSLTAYEYSVTDAARY